MPRDSWLRVLLRTAGLRAAVLPISALCSLATSALIIQHTGAAAFGIISMVAQLQLALPFADLGMGAAVARAAARADRSAAEARLLRVLLGRTALLLVGVGTTGAALVVLAGTLGLYSRVLDVPAELESQLDAVVSTVLVLFLLSLPLGLSERILLGRDRTDLLVLCGLVPTVGNLTVVAVLTRTDVPAPWLALGLPVSTVLVLVLCCLLALLHPRSGIAGLLRSARGPVEDGPRSPSSGGVLVAALPVLVAMAGTVLAEQHGRAVLAAVSTPLAVSEYAIALQLYMPAYSVLYMAAGVFWPRFAVRLDARLWRRANAALMAMGIAAAAALVVLTRPVARWVSGGELVPPWLLVLGLAAAMVAQSAHLTQLNLLTDPSGYVRLAAMAAALLLLVVPGTILGVRLGLGSAAPAVSMACGVAVAQVGPGLLVARRRVAAAARTTAPETEAARPRTTPTPSTARSSSAHRSSAHRSSADCSTDDAVPARSAGASQERMTS